MQKYWTHTCVLLGGPGEKACEPKPLLWAAAAE